MYYYIEFLKWENIQFKPKRRGAVDTSFASGTEDPGSIPAGV
jgi:hypothetical protein